MLQLFRSTETVSDHVYWNFLWSCFLTLSLIMFPETVSDHVSWNFLWSCFRLGYMYTCINWLLFQLKWVEFQLYLWQEQVTFDEMIMISTFYYTNTLSWIFIVWAHWNNSPSVDMSLHLNTLSWFRPNQSLLFLLNTSCLAEKNKKPVS